MSEIIFNHSRARWRALDGRIAGAMAPSHPPAVVRRRSITPTGYSAAISGTDRPARRDRSSIQRGRSLRRRPHHRRARPLADCEVRGAHEPLQPPMAREAHDATSVLECLTGLLERVPGQLRRTLTFDQGREMARHTELAVKPSIEIFFAEPHHRWQRPSKKAFNGLLRR